MNLNQEQINKIADNYAHTAIEHNTVFENHKHDFKQGVMAKFPMKFNLNDDICVQITDYGWEQLTKHHGPSFVYHCIRTYKTEIEGEEWYKLQMHKVIEFFGPLAWFSFPAPLKPNIIIP